MIKNSCFYAPGAYSVDLYQTGESEATCSSAADALAIAATSSVPWPLTRRCPIAHHHPVPANEMRCASDGFLLYCSDLPRILPTGWFLWSESSSNICAPVLAGVCEHSLEALATSNSSCHLSTSTYCTIFLQCLLLKVNSRQCSATGWNTFYATLLEHDVREKDDVSARMASSTRCFHCQMRIQAKWK